MHFDWYKIPSSWYKIKHFGWFDKKPLDWYKKRISSVKDICISAILSKK
jgi:hypothetical protein